MQRRDWLKVLGTVGMGSIAGCSGSNSEGPEATPQKTTIEHAEEGPPYFEKVDIDVPNSSMTLETYNFSVTVANTGGRVGNFSTTVNVGEEPFDVSIPIQVENVKPGEVRTAEFGPKYFTRTGEYNFRITDYGVYDNIEIEPYRAEGGKQVTIRGVLIQPRLLRIDQNMAIYRDEDSSETTVLASNEDEVLVTLEITIENRGDESKHFGPSDFSMSEGENILDEYDFLGGIKGVGRKPLSYLEFEPEDYTNGWVVFEVPEDQLNTGLELQYPAESPDVIWEFEPDEEFDIPKYEMVNSSVPDSVVAYNNATVEYTIKNTGESSGTFNALSSVEEGSRSMIETELAPSETYTVSGTYRIPPSGEIRPVNVSFYGHNGGMVKNQITPEVPKLATGERYHPKEGLIVEVADIQVGTTLETKSWGAYSEESLSEGYKWLFVKIESSSSDSAIPVATKDEFSIESNRADFEIMSEYPGFGDSHGEAFTGSVTGTFYDPSGSATGPNQSQSGWIVYEIPSDISLSDLDIRWTAGTGSYSDISDRGHPYQAIWSE